MCGRFSIYSPLGEFSTYFMAESEPDVAASYQPSFNVPPTEQILGVSGQGGPRRLGMYRWGLVPYFVDDPSIAGRTFNARAEGLRRSRLFASAFSKRRLLVPADSFFEWSKRADDAGTPYRFRRADGAPLAFAGLYETWRHREGPVISSLTIVTTRASEDLAGLHDRMPVILDPDAFEVWLSTDDLDQAESLLVPAPTGTLISHPVDRRVGSVRENDEELIALATTTTAAPAVTPTGKDPGAHQGRLDLAID